MTLSIEKELQLLHHIPFLHIHGEQDAVVLTEHHAVRYTKYSKKHQARTKFILLPNSDHDFSDPAEQKIALDETCQWFLETLYERELHARGL